mmetsp:Transcript_124077/g.356283  ORF Transcript_124077/g.356283 Transcript_124077/m.356283 type:complete len:397 (+) Transcript_124077:119-1309(+)
MGTHEDAPSEFREVADKDRVEVARWVLEEIRYLDRSDAELANSSMYRFAGSLAGIPLVSRQAFAKKAVAGAGELNHDEMLELAEYVRAALPALSGRAGGAQPPLLQNVGRVLSTAASQGVPRGEQQALLQAVQEEAAARIRENPVTVSAAFAHLSRGEREAFIGELIAAGLLEPSQRAAAERMLHPDTHGLLAISLLLYTFRWGFAIVPVLELFAWYDLPRTVDCGSWFSSCDDRCTLTRWLFFDAVLWLGIVAAAALLAGDCLLLFNQFRADSVAMVQNLRGAAAAEDPAVQAKELGVDVEVVNGARTGFLVVAGLVALAALVAVWGVVAAFLNLLSCKLVTFVIAVAFVGLRVCMLAGVGFLVWHAYLAIIADDDGDGSDAESGAGAYGTFAAT